MQPMRWIYAIVIVLPITILFAVVNARLYYAETTPQFNDVPAQLQFIKEKLQSGAGYEMQQYFPEGYFFSYVLYGMAWVDVGLKQPELAEQALAEARWSMNALESADGKAVFSESLTPPYGVFYFGWSNWLRGGILKLQAPAVRDAEEVDQFVAAVAAAAAAFDESETPFLQAYPGQAWPVDSTVGMAAIRLHDSLFEPQYTATISRWIQLAKNKLDPSTGLLPHRVDAQSGDLLQGTRGSSQSVIQRFLPEIDADWASEQYALFRDQFATTLLGVPGILEYPSGTAGMGDVDSGPLIGGISLSASVVTVAAATVEGDTALANAMLNVGEALGMPIEANGNKRYALGVLPVGDAFLAWAKSATGWTFNPPATDYAPLTASWWRLPIHAVSAVAVGGLWWLLLRKRHVRETKNA